MKGSNGKVLGNTLKTWLKDNKGILAICLAYAIISCSLLLFVLGGHDIANLDKESYIQPALHILRDGFFSTDGVNPEYSRTPGYPLFIALIYFLGGTDMSIIVIQIALLTFKVYLFYKTLCALSTPKMFSLLGSALLLINVPSYTYSFSVQTETLFGFLLLLALYWLVKYLYHGRNLLYFAGFSLSLNYALLTRPVLLYFNLLLCAALFVFLILRKISGKCFMSFFLCWVLMFGGWSLRNYAHSSVFLFTTINNNDVTTLQAPVIQATVDGIDVPDPQQAPKEVADAIRESLLREYPELNGSDLNEAQKSLLRGKYGYGLIKKHFGIFVLLNLKGFVAEMFTSFRLTFLYQSTGMSKTAVFIQLVQIGFCAFLYITYLLFFAGFAIDRRHNTAVHVAILLTAAYLSIPGAIYATPRFRDPFFPLLLLSAVNRLPAVIDFFRKQRRERKAQQFSF